MQARQYMYKGAGTFTFTNVYWKWGCPIFVLSIALILRLIVIFQFRDLNPLFENPIIDAWRYDTLAKDFLHSGTWPESGAFFQPPAYPFFLAVVYSLFGESYTWIRVIQACLGALSCVFVCLLGTKLYSRRIGFSAGLITAMYGPLIFFELDLLAPVLIIFGSTLGLLLLHLGLQHTQKKFLLGAGFFLGVAFVSWPIIGLFCAGVFFIIIWDFRSSRRQALTIFLTIAFGLLIPILPVFFHNIMHGEWVLISTNGGINFFIGNNPNWQETVSMRPGYPWEKILTLPYQLYGAEKVNKIGDSSKFFRESFNYIASHPFTYARNQLIKLYQIVFGYEIMRNTDLYFFKQYSPVLNKLIFKSTWLKFPFGLLLPFAATGIFTSFGRIPKKNTYLFAYLATISLGLILFFVTARYRIILVPVLAIYASLGFGEIKNAMPEHKKNALYLLSILLGVAVISNLNIFNQQRIFESSIYQAQAPFTLGRINLERNNPEKALIWLKKSVNIDPFYPDAWVDIGRAQFALGNTSDAIVSMKKAITVAPDYPLPYYNLGLIYDQTSLPKAMAVNYYQQFLSKSETYFETVIQGTGRHTYVLNRIEILTSPTKNQ